MAEANNLFYDLSHNGTDPVLGQVSGIAKRAAVKRGVRRVTEGLSEILFERVSAAEWRALDSVGALFENMNTPEDYAEAKRRIEDLASS
jgi:hypothetical protein